MEFTGTTRVWLSDSQWKSAAELESLVKSGNTDRAVEYISISKHDMGTSGWVEIGTAVVTVTLHDTEAVTAKQVAALQEELRKFRVDAHEHEQALLARISKLQALTFNPA